MNFFILHGRDFFRERSIIYEKKIIGRMGGSGSGSGSPDRVQQPEYRR